MKVFRIEIVTYFVWIMLGIILITNSFGFIGFVSWLITGSVFYEILENYKKANKKIRIKRIIKESIESKDDLYQVDKAINEGLGSAFRNKPDY